MKKYLLSSLLFIASLFLNGCKGYLDVVPENDIETIETNFEKREDALEWLKTCLRSERGASSKQSRILRYRRILRWRFCPQFTKHQ